MKATHTWRDGVCVNCRLMEEQVAAIEALEAYTGGLLAIFALSLIAKHGKEIAEVFKQSAELREVAEGPPAGDLSADHD